MLHELKGNAGTLRGIAAACAACAWLAATPHTASGATSTATGQAIDFRPEDPRDADAVLRMTEMFVSGRARMFAELDGGNVVRAVQIAGPRLR